MLFRTRPLASLIAGSVLAASLATTAGGCIMRGRNKGFAYAANGALIVTGGVLLRTNESTCSSPLDQCPAPAYGTRTLDLMGGTLLAIGAVGLALQLANDLQPAAAPADFEPPPPRDTDDVRVLTADAKQSAQAGACADVRNAGFRVQQLDPIYYRAVFRADVDILSCLQ